MYGREYLRVLKDALAVINSLDYYPLEKAALIKNVALLRKAWSKYNEGGPNCGGEFREELDRVESLVRNTEDTTILKDRELENDLVDIVFSPSFQTAKALLTEEGLAIYWECLVKDLPEGVNKDYGYYASIR